MRDRRGEMLFALSFSLQASSSVEAELLAVVIATIWSMNAFKWSGNGLLDCLSYIKDGGFGRWSNAIKEMTLLSNRKGVLFRQVWRESNWTARYLAAHKPAHLTPFFDMYQLRGPVHKAYYMDLFGIPSVRFNF
ncbi:unnamed protein product [Cuscuta epithymum]|uniref:RNase H type-1 domain-containing protein n=1 Tax=Cuscuta epithymum TaxID=186058 RepID=A0AAV0EGT2_9ASTE|nr:unnamed protein product [Cuscuta epithymum]